MTFWTGVAIGAGVVAILALVIGAYVLHRFTRGFMAIISRMK